MFVATYNPYLLILVVFVLTWSFQLSLTTDNFCYRLTSLTVV